MQLYFIRHAQSVNNLLHDQTGTWANMTDDPELTDTGVKQAQLLAAHLAETRSIEPRQRWDPFNARAFNITHLYASPMIRAAHTASVVGQAIGLSPVLWEDLHECGGLYLDGANGEKIGQPGKNRAWFEERFPTLSVPATIGDEGWWNHRPVETGQERLARAARVWQTLIARHGNTDDHVALVSHGDFFVRFMTVVLEIGLREHLWMGMQNTAIARIDYAERGDLLALLYTCRVAHLPLDMIT